MWMFIAKIMLLVLITIQLVIINDNLLKIEKAIKEKEQDKIETVANVEAEYVIIEKGGKWDIKMKGRKK